MMVNSQVSWGIYLKKKRKRATLFYPFDAIPIGERRRVSVSASKLSITNILYRMLVHLYMFHDLMKVHLLCTVLSVEVAVPLLFLMFVVDERWPRTIPLSKNAKVYKERKRKLFRKLKLELMCIFISEDGVQNSFMARNTGQDWQKIPKNVERLWKIKKLKKQKFGSVISSSVFRSINFLLISLILKSCFLKSIILQSINTLPDCKRA